MPYFVIPLLFPPGGFFLRFKLVVTQQSLLLWEYGKSAGAGFEYWQHVHESL